MKHKFLKIMIFMSFLMSISLSIPIFYLKNATKVCQQLLIKFDNYQTVIATGDVVTVKPPEQALNFSVTSNCQGQLVASPPVLIQDDYTYVVNKRYVEHNAAIPPTEPSKTIDSFALTIE
ncbi:MAG: hypothetical protein WA432_00845 [Candidatus Babeliaceae bacterium]